MSKRTKWILAIVAVLLVVAAAAAVVVLFLLPYRDAHSSMQTGATLTIQQQDDESLVLSWPASGEADYYCVELLLPPENEDAEPEAVFRDFVMEGTSYTLPTLPTSLEMILRVNSVVTYQTPGEDRTRYGDDPLELTLTFDTPQITNLSWIPDPDAKTVSMEFDMEEGDRCRVYLVGEDGGLTLLKTLEDTSLVLTFGEDGDLPMPGYEETVTLAFDAYRQIPGLDYYGSVNRQFTVAREDLLGRGLNLQLTDEGHNVCTLTWNETKGDHYEVQTQNADGEWVTLATVAEDGERTYTSGHLASYSEFSYRVVAVGGQTMENSDYAAISGPLCFETDASPIYCTVWATKKMDAYSDPQQTQVVGTVEACQAFCVLDEQNGMFGVRLDGEMCYIDSNYCLINLTEYLQDLCSYDITNSYASLYMVHEYEIPEVTNVVTAGYEKVQLADGSFLVPLLYPTAQKILTAAKSAISQGYRLKIYDAFRPYKATREIYDLTEVILDEPIPEEPFTDKKVDDLPTVGEDEVITYRLLMTNNTWNLGSFLAAKGSMHNLGVAVDLTLEDLETGEELEMQTSIHDLSWYSVVSKNNKNAKTLASIMTAADLGTLTSEWWHFQDNQARQDLSPASVYGGVSPECWMADDNGWRYRRYNGSYFYSCERTIGGVVYTFDENGYVVDTGNT